MLQSLPTAGVELDIVEELQLRRWARQNYVTPEERVDDWHQVIREEMQLRDAEMIVGNRARDQQSSFVPLVPDSGRQFHPAHSVPETPNMPTEPATSDRQRMVSPAEFV